MPTLWVDTRLLGQFSQVYQLNAAHLETFYKACGVVIHNQTPLPFFSLLEVKFFKNFLEGCLESFTMVVQKLIGRKIALQKPEMPVLSEESSKVCIGVADDLARGHAQEIEQLISKSLASLPKKDSHNPQSTLIEPLTLVSIFHLISVNWKHLNDQTFTEDDLDRVVQLLQPLSFKVSIEYEVRDTLSAMQELLVAEMEKYDTFSSLLSVQMKRKVVLYLLLLYLPKLVREKMNF
jgi:hypothetical protein